ncbi:MAG: hypothetical protein A2049_10430 [Elusimicrobia bacterium GWA2_62_23]|nr:MAG: hypothetical protein A2049_10430 [Elusimicrobia bacterium GWA2_62_23]
MLYVKFAHEYDRRLKIGVIGCGKHAFRFIYPALRYLPVELKSVCSRSKEKAEACAKSFGAEHSYSDYHEMLSREQLDAVLVITDYDPSGCPKYPAIAIDCMRAGVHVWIEKPPAASVAQILEMRAVSVETGKIVLVGFKKMFYPAVERAREIVSGKDFGKLTSISIRYGTSLPFSTANRNESIKMKRFLDDFMHPASLLQLFGGPARSVYFQINELTGASSSVLMFENGVIGNLYLAGGQAETSPRERLELVGEGANLVIENGVELTYYRKGPLLTKALLEQGVTNGYGRISSYIGDDSVAPIVWKPEFSLGQLNSNSIFLMGYYQELLCFTEAVLNNIRPDRATLDDALGILKLFEAYKREPGIEIAL